MLNTSYTEQKLHARTERINAPRAHGVARAGHTPLRARVAPRCAQPY